jgi:iron complex outermembrane receptor protein
MMWSVELKRLGGDVARFIRRHQAGVFVVLATLWLAICPVVNAMADSVEFDIAAQPMPQALKRFAAQAHLQLLFDYKAVEALKTSAVRGRFEARDALGMLLRGTGLTFQQVNDHTIAIKTSKTTSDEQAAPAAPSGETQDRIPVPGVRVAQVDQGQTPSPSTVENPDEQTSKKRPIQLEEVIVTGSRIPVVDGRGPQDVKIYTQEQIEQSGQTTLANFFNTLAEVSTSSGENGYQTRNGQTTVQLRGLPIGTTLVLIDGHRVETSGRNGTFFDLNTIPLAAVARIEIIPEGSSAIYGSDAIGGVVNIILKHSLDDLEVHASYGSAPDLDEYSADVAWGHKWSRGSITATGSYYTRPDALTTDDRSLTSDHDFTRFGGMNFDSPFCNPGNVYSLSGSNLPGLTAPFAAVPHNIRGVATLLDFVPTAGQSNTCDPFAGFPLLPATHRVAGLLSGDYKISDSVQLFAEMLYSHLAQYSYGGHPALVQADFAGSNPYNPFGQDVLVDYSFNTLDMADNQYTNFVRPLLGARGNIAGSWEWEVSGWISRDSNYDVNPYSGMNSTNLAAALSSSSPIQAINPFTSGTPASSAILSSIFPTVYVNSASQTNSINGFVRGPLLTLPGGAVNMVLGAEYDHDELKNGCYGDPNYCFGGTDSFYRKTRAVFSEIRIPVFGDKSRTQSTEVLTLSAAVRNSHSNDFGSATTPQFGVEWRPLETLLLRASYADSYRAPMLSAINFVSFQEIQQPIIDPLRGDAVELVNANFGGNPNLKPETGISRTLGVVWRPSLTGLELNLTHWQVYQRNRITFLDTQVIVDNEADFPNCIMRAPSQGGQPGPIESIDCAGYVNFGSLDVAGVDLVARDSVTTKLGTFGASVSVTETYRYEASITPDAPPTNRVSTASTDAWSPRWKGLLTVDWSRGPIFLQADSRYVGRYLDYQDLGANTTELGDFFLYDFSAKYDLSELVKLGHLGSTRAGIEASVSNVFNSLPRFSHYPAGYDPSQYDIVGRFVHVGVRLTF